jgi:hypothetical protein
MRKEIEELEREIAELEREGDQTSNRFALFYFLLGSLFMFTILLVAR